MGSRCVLCEYILLGPNHSLFNSHLLRIRYSPHSFRLCSRVAARKLKNFTAVTTLFQRGLFLCCCVFVCVRVCSLVASWRKCVNWSVFVCWWWFFFFKGGLCWHEFSYVFFGNITERAARRLFTLNASDPIRKSAEWVKGFFAQTNWGATTAVVTEI